MSGYEIRINGEHVGTLYDDGDIYSGGKRVGHLYEDGEIYSGGIKVGSMGVDGSIWSSEGNSGYRVYDDGDIYYYGKCVGSIWGYEQFLAQRMSGTGQSSSYESDKSGSGFADKAADAAKIAGTAAAASNAGCGGIIVILIAVAVALAYFINWAGGVLGYVIIIAPIAFIIYKVAKRKGEDPSLFDASKRSAKKAERAAQKEERAKQKAQEKAAREASRKQAESAREQERARKNQQNSKGQTSQSARVTSQKAVYVCPSCGQKLSAPGVRGKIKITCPKCKTITVFDSNRNPQPNSQVGSSGDKGKSKHSWAIVLVVLLLFAGIMYLDSENDPFATNHITVKSGSSSVATGNTGTTGTAGVSVPSNDYYMLTLPTSMSDVDVVYDAGHMSGTTAVGATTTIMRNGLVLFRVSCISNDWGPQGSQGNVRIGVPSKAPNCTVYVVVPAYPSQSSDYDIQVAQNQARKYAAYVTLL